MRLLPCSILLVALAPAFGSCSKAPAAARPNVLVITVDSLRADHLGCYGYERETSPNLDKLATEAVLFERAYSHAPFTAPSHASLLTSLHTKTHGVHAWAETLSPTAHNLAERLSPVGYRTGAFYNHPGMRTSQVMRRFDEVQERFFEEAPITADAFLAWVDGDEQPFAAWVHLWDVHRPYGFRDWNPDYFRGRIEREPNAMTLAYEETRFGTPTPPSTVEMGRTEGAYNLSAQRRAELVAQLGPQRTAADLDYITSRYDGGVWYADQGLGQLLDGLAQRGLLDNTLVVITADHGESLREREPCYFTHDPFLYEETLHVPLLVRLPGAEHAGERVSSLTRHVDIIPTIHEVLDVPLLGDEQGKSLVPAIEGKPQGLTFLLAQTKTKNAKERVARIEPGVEGWLEERVALSDGKYKLIHDVALARWSLFDLTADPKEQEDLSGDPAHADRLASLQEVLRTFGATLPEAGDTTAELSGELEELLTGTGYLGN